MRVIATEVKNLTDARYFAAWGVDIICYDVDPDGESGLSVVQLQEITDWVEGPEIGIKVDGLSVPDGYTDSDIDIVHFLIGPYIDRSELPATIDGIYRIVTLSDSDIEEHKVVLTLDRPFASLQDEELSGLELLCSSHEVYLDSIFEPADLPKISSCGLAGIIVKGGEEEKVGYKSFDDLDDILETIYD